MLENVPINIPHSRCYAPSTPSSYSSRANYEHNHDSQVVLVEDHAFGQGLAFLLRREADLGVVALSGSPKGSRGLRWGEGPGWRMGHPQESTNATGDGFRELLTTEPSFLERLLQALGWIEDGG